MSGRFSIEVVASAADIDAFGHVSNLVYLRWVQEVAAAHSTTVGWAAADYLALGAFFAVRRHEIDYLAPAHAGDTLRLSTWIDGWRAASSLRRTEIARVSDGVVLARGVTQWAFIDRASGRPRRIPDDIRARFEPL